nr:reverse transcriptase domain-containing protein [Tanacetum cinerariifolium]GEY89819.1 reverse transcriptase domain-containing protein [Tanacetum cinerariifolium]
MAVIKSNLGWKVKDFKGMTFEEIEAKFTIVGKQLEDFIPMGSKEEAKRLKRKGLSIEQESVKKLKTSEEVTEEAKSPDEVPEEKVKEMMQLVPIEEVYVEVLQVKHLIIDWKLWALVKESLSNRPPTSDKEIELWVELKRLYEPDDEDQLWTHTQNLMHAPIEWKLYDTCGVHHVTAKDKEIFILMEKDYPLRKGLAIVMICYKLQVENYSQMANDLILKIYKIANCPSQQGTSGNARVWYDKEPSNSVLTWEDFVNKFVNQFFPPLKTTHLRNTISHFTQRFEETFREAWERFKEMLRARPHHGFTELAQIDTFYNGLDNNDQDS